jgi:glycosyltransferase involved in cell wall biosynthesis
LNLSTPKVTVILPCYNHSNTVIQAINSVFTSQYPNKEIIISDDCSKDDSLLKIKSWVDKHDKNIKVLSSEKNQGICRSLNESLKLATGEFIVLLATDDWHEPNAISFMVDTFLRLPSDVSFLHAQVQKVTPVGEPISSNKMTHTGELRETFFNELILGNTINAPATIIRKSYLSQIGGYDETLIAEDYDLWLRLLHISRAFYVDFVMTNYRIGPESLSHNPSNRVQLNVMQLSVLSKWVDKDVATDKLISKRFLQLSVEIMKSGKFEVAEKWLKENRKIRNRPNYIKSVLYSSWVFKASVFISYRIYKFLRKIY